MRRALHAGAARTAASGVAAVGVGGAVAYAGSKVTAQRGTGAGVELWNTIADAENPEVLDADAAAAIRKRYGKTSRSVPGIKSTYFNYLIVRRPPMPAQYAMRATSMAAAVWCGRCGAVAQRTPSCSRACAFLKGHGTP